MTKVKLIVTVEVDGKEAVRTAPEFLIGFKEKLPVEQLEGVAASVQRDIAAHIQAGVRRHAPGKGIKIWPEQG